MKKLLLIIAIFALSIASAKAYRTSVQRVSYPGLEFTEKKSQIVEIAPVSAKQGGNSPPGSCCLAGEDNPYRGDAKPSPLRKSSCSCCG
ncbi:MAG: hypothetical protein GTN70_06490 [Deltaproteobacteria bacterium]|nr:hypothetical protein [Deltaproteobacteria bacterium]NIS77333.1 hypothetical protein [Deltaproteobacteria bacterium]